jgi:hypothetical protein
MGQASRNKQARKDALATARRRTVTALSVQLADQPGIQAMREADMADEALAARCKADFPAQRTRLRRAGWVHVQPHSLGAGAWQHLPDGLRMLHSVGRWEDGRLWAHMSLSRADGRMPEWHQLRDAHWLLYPALKGIQVVVPPSQHVTFSEVAHLWTSLDGDVVPDFGKFGTI